MKRRLICLLLCAATASFAKPFEQTLGLNLAYVRVHTLPDDLPAASATSPGAKVLDLRFVKADQKGSEALSAWLKTSAKATNPVFVLVNGETSPTVLAALPAGKTTPGVVSIGPVGPGPKPDIALEVSPSDDRAAYDALEQGTKLDDLIARKLEKVRRDEASVVRDRSATLAAVKENDTPRDNAPVDTAIDGKLPATPETEPKPAVTTPPPAPPVDAVLQRAVHIHRALLALKKI